MVGNQVKPGHRESWTKYSKQRECGQSPWEGTEPDSIENNVSRSLRWAQRQWKDEGRARAQPSGSRSSWPPAPSPAVRPAFTRQGLDQAQGQSSPQNQQLNNDTMHCKSETWMKVNLPWKGMCFQSVPETLGIQYYAMYFKQYNQLNSLV